MEITGRLTADAEIRKTKSKKELVAFTIAVNDSYKAKDGERKDIAEYFNCAYWLSTKIADNLHKGSIVTVHGWVYLNEYQGKDGNKYASLNCHVSGIKLIANAKKKSAEQTTTTPIPETKDDLPF